MISIHVNDSDSFAANGTEVLYNDDKEFAQGLLNALLNGMNLTNRGVKERTELAVLKFPGKAALIELGFIKNPADLKAMRDPAIISATCKLLAKTIML